MFKVRRQNIGNIVNVCNNGCNRENTMSYVHVTDSEAGKCRFKP